MQWRLVQVQFGLYLSPQQEQDFGLVFINKSVGAANTINQWIEAPLDAQMR